MIFNLLKCFEIHFAREDQELASYHSGLKNGFKKAIFKDLTSLMVTLDYSMHFIYCKFLNIHCYALKF